MCHDDQNPRASRPRRDTTRHSYPAFAVTVDMVILTMAAGRLQVLLVRRGEAPFRDMWAIPGGFKRPDETLDRAAQRELRGGDRGARRPAC